MQQLSCEERDRLGQQVVEASGPVAQSWPLKTFAYRNPLRGLEHLPFGQAVRQAKHALGGEGYLPNDEYRELFRSGAITEAAVNQALSRFTTTIETVSVGSETVSLGKRQVESRDVLRLHLLFGLDPLDPALLTWTLLSGDLRSGKTRAAFRQDMPMDSGARGGSEVFQPETLAGPAALAELWESTLAAVRRAERNESSVVTETLTPEIELPAGRTLSDWVGLLSGRSIVDQINDQMIKWSAAFLDEGMSSWQMPGRQSGFYLAWRELARRDFSGRFLGIKRFGRKVRELPDSPQQAISQSLSRLGIPQSRWTEYLGRQFAQLPGWAGFIRWRGENPGYPPQQKHPIDAAQYLAVRLFYEAELVQATCRREWGIEGTLPAIVADWQGRPQEYLQRIGETSHAVDAETRMICGDGWRLFHLAQLLELTPQDVAAMSGADVRTLLGWIDAMRCEDHGAVWLDALETSYRDRLLAGLSPLRPDADIETTGHADSVTPIRESTAGESTTLGQFVFCIDVRSEPMRRQIEDRGAYQTFGFAGFFGIPISYQAFDSHDPAALCPVILSPQFAVNEVPRSDQTESLQAYASSSRWNRLGDRLFHDLKRNVISSFMLIDVLGLFFSAMLVGKTFFHSSYESLVNRVWGWFSRPVATQIPVQPAGSEESSAEPELPHGFTLDQQAAFVGGALRAIGLTDGLGRFVVLCGHGSTSENNPYFAAYNCGACGGGHGDANARVFAAMANNPKVRGMVSESGLQIPDETWFIAAKHNTVTDSITFYDQEEIPEGHAEDFQKMISDVQGASTDQAGQRIGRLPQAPENLSPQQAREHLLTRSFDWANVRPEWGLSGNAAIILGRRSLTDGVDLDGRVFLQSYDPDGDPEGAILEALMTAPLVVAQWISMEYYFSAVDPDRYGSGSKVTHNVVSGIGVMHGAHGDLQSGLPLQSVNDGSEHYHHPVRLLAIIESPTSRIDDVVGKHVLLQQLLHNQWINLVAVDPSSGEYRRFNPNSTWESLS